VTFTALELEGVRLRDRCFQGRRLVNYRGSWYVFPSEEPRPTGSGRGSIARTAGFRGFAAPRVEWQSGIPMANGQRRKPQVLAPEPVMRKGERIPHREQVAKASKRTFDKGTVTKMVKPIVAGSGDGERVYKRPVLRVGGKRQVDTGKVVRQLDGGPVYWRSRERTADGKRLPLRTLDPLTDEQVKAIEFELWLQKKFPIPVDRFLYLVRKRNALVVVNHSGGKDSQAMYLYLTRDLGVPREQIRVVHADLPGADWPGTLDHVKKTVDEKVKVVRAKFKDGMVKELYDYVAKRKKFPSSAQRYCTSDLKTSPINAWIRQALCERNGLPKRCEVPKTGQRIVISAMGMRAQESHNRGGLAPWELNVGQSIAGRLWFEFLPIHGWTENQVFSEIKRHGQKPFWIYGQTPADCKRLIEAGSVDSQGRCVAMRRMSCVFCIMSSTRDIGVASLIGPKKIAEEICRLEGETGHTFKAGTTFPELIKKGRAEVFEGVARKSLQVLKTARERRGPCK